YEGRVELLIEADNPNVVSFKEVIDEQRSKADYYQTQYKLLESRTLARKTIDDLKLWDNKELGGGSGPRQPGLRLRLLALFGYGPEPSTVQSNETLAQAEVIEGFLNRLAISPIRNSRLVDVSFRSADPRLADSVATSLAKTYIQQDLQFKFMSSKEASDWLSDQLAEQRKKVEQSEAALQRYREQNDAVSLEQRQDITVQKLADLNAAVTKAKTERIEKEALYRQLQSLQSNRAALDTFPAILSNDFIQRQKVELTGLQRQLAELSEKL